jgi:uncharacterized protein
MLAAKWNYGPAQCSLGWQFDIGKGVLQDSAQAVQWYRRSAENGDPQAEHDLGCSYRDGSGVDRDLEEAFDWFMKAARRGHANGQVAGFEFA